ncbi:hypothetical protein BDV27DRAFT_133121 [Aspergillus caelatus]|uniref:Uncharacterized protein n=1 Tax=Aspergillus caelatus TaxID=61420 RepID=A0A5N6ZWU1_9EURO|nr:uncharacterized protein BDV27DRAFT_133121 [Aspergillus caelatus]KAE8361399.1 hypothetical protein BDV27DRAFT_133121 [Aspergillus caelatus]
MAQHGMILEGITAQQRTHFLYRLILPISSDQIVHIWASFLASFYCTLVIPLLYHVLVC